MRLIKIKLGNVIEILNERCGNPHLSIFDVSGVNRDKEFFEPSQSVGEDTSNYKKVPPRYFACNLMHVGRDKVLPIAYNHTNYTKVVSPAYTTFKLKDNAPLLDYYFFILLKSEERDRYFWFHTDGSVRDGMAWEDFCDVEVMVPSVEIQQKYVNMYKAMLANQQSYERGLDDLMLTCIGTIEMLRHNTPLQRIGDFIGTYNEKNIDGSISLEQGVNIDKQFITPQRGNSNLLGRKIVRHGQFA